MLLRPPLRRLFLLVALLLAGIDVGGAPFVQQRIRPEDVVPPDELPRRPPREGGR